MRYVTNEQRRRRTLFKPTLWAVASWLIFCVAHSLRIDFRYARRSRLENQPTDRRRYASYL
jgi:hypothetical protein